MKCGFAKAELPVTLPCELAGYAQIEKPCSSMIPVTVQQLDRETLVFLPLELYSELRNKITDSHIQFICYLNGCSLYLCNEETFLNGYYESRILPFEKGEGEVRCIDCTI